MKTLLFILSALWAIAPTQAGSLLTDFRTNKACYAPGMPVVLSLTLANGKGQPEMAGIVRLACRHLDSAVLGPAPQRFRLAPGQSQTLRFTWRPPTFDFQGYQVEATALDAAQRVLDTETTAVDVSSNWTRFPRYGYLSQFGPQARAVTENEIRQLCEYHLNSLQFYDWQFRHEKPLAGTAKAPADSWKDLALRPTSRQTILDFLDAAHTDGMVAFNYNLCYGAWSGYGDEGVDYRWGLWRRDHTNQDSLPMPGGWATPAIYLFNPADPGWQHYLFREEYKAFAAYPFDGWQVDQVGERGMEYDSADKPVDVWRTFRPFLTAARSALHKRLVFNNVGGYGLYDVAAKSPEDVVYVECWEWTGQKSYADLKTVIDQASQWSGGKGVVLAAYMNKSYAQKFSPDHPGTFNASGVLLADAAIFASGGDHIELGDGGFLLDSEYFPNHNLVPSAALRQSLRRYRDFQVAYENILRGGLMSGTGKIVLSVPSSGDARPDTIWAFTKASASRHVLHFINLRGERDNAWRDDNGAYPAPIPQSKVDVRYYYGRGTVHAVHWASPDTDQGRSHALPFTTGTNKDGAFIHFTLPTLADWDMVYLDVI